MSVLIKYMMIPSSCAVCEWSKYYGKYAMCLRMKGSVDIEIARRRRADFCPLFEVPDKHGDLIDRGALRDSFNMGSDCSTCKTSDKVACEYDRVYTKMNFCEWLDEAETIIEAEGSGS